jgi:hypothetical protein
MTHSWRIRIRPRTFAPVRRLADLPLWFAAAVRRICLDDFPKLMAHAQLAVNTTATGVGSTSRTSVSH